MAQSTNFTYGGIALNRDLMLSSEIASLSNRQNFGTARSMAMGNALTSLGGDISSMSINPAGLGMYRSDNFSVTPMVTVAKASTPSTDGWYGNTESNFAIGNLGLVLNVYQGQLSNGKPVSISFGMALNRVADYNYTYSYSSLSEYNASSGSLSPSIADIFASQLGNAGVYPDSDGRLGTSSTNPELWPAVLGYNGYMVSALSDSEGDYWTSDTIGANASIAHGVQLESSGSINEYLFSMGVNISNFLYVGATLGVESVRLDQTLIYQEEYLYSDEVTNSSGDKLSSTLDYANIWQRSVVKGYGINFKIGAIIRPSESLRIGVAYHTPTAYSLTRSYQGNIESLLVNSSASEFNSYTTNPLYDDGSNSWEFSSPSRLLLGISYTIGSMAIVAVDYERAWYNSININSIPSNTGFSVVDYNNDFENNYQPTNTLRAGAEIKPLAKLALRVGGGFSTSMLTDESVNYNSMTPTSNFYIAGGVGFNLSDNTTLDITYQNMQQEYSNYCLFYEMNDNGSFSTTSGKYSTSITYHTIVATLGFKF